MAERKIGIQHVFGTLRIYGHTSPDEVREEIERRKRTIVEWQPFYDERRKLWTVSFYMTYGPWKNDNAWRSDMAGLFYDKRIKGILDHQFDVDRCYREASIVDTIDDFNYDRSKHARYRWWVA